MAELFQAAAAIIGVKDATGVYLARVCETSGMLWAGPDFGFPALGRGRHGGTGFKRPRRRRLYLVTANVAPKNAEPDAGVSALRGIMRSAAEFKTKAECHCTTAIFYRSRGWSAYTPHGTSWGLLLRARFRCHWVPLTRMRPKRLVDCGLKACWTNATRARDILTMTHDGGGIEPPFFYWR